MKQTQAHVESATLYVAFNVVLLDRQRSKARDTSEGDHFVECWPTTVELSSHLRSFFLQSGPMSWALPRALGAPSTERGLCSVRRSSLVNERERTLSSLVKQSDPPKENVTCNCCERGYYLWQVSDRNNA